MTLIEVIDQARNILSEPLETTRSFPDDVSSYWTDTEMTGFFNLVQQEVAQEIQGVFEDYFITQTSINTVTEQENYTLPSDFVKMRRVEDQRFTNPVELEAISMNDQDDHYYNTLLVDAGQPRAYFIRGTEIVFDPKPSFTTSSAIKLHYIKRLPDVTAATATSEIPSEWHRVLVWGVVNYCLYKQQTPNDHATLEYQRGLANIRKHAEQRQVHMSRQVKRTKRYGRNY